jgi:hypothetical protein
LEAGLRVRDRARLRATLGDGIFESAYDEGLRMSQEEAVTLALSTITG